MAPPPLKPADSLIITPAAQKDAGHHDERRRQTTRPVSAKENSPGENGKKCDIVPTFPFLAQIYQVSLIST